MSASHVSTWYGKLQETGHCIVPGLLSAEQMIALEGDLDTAFEKTSFCDGEFYGRRTKRLGRLLCKSPVCADLVLQKTILALANMVLGEACDRIQLNVAQAIEIHPGEIAQFPHRDQDMWPGAGKGQEFLLNVIWPLTPFTAENGATRIYPRSHRRQSDSWESCGEPVAMECRPGDAICFLGSTLHGAGANHSTLPRRAVVTGYSLGWLKPYENLWLSYPPGLARKFSPELAALAGYAQHRPNLGNFEGQCPSILLREEVPEFPHAIDGLRPDQAKAVREFASSCFARK